jgi:hypothetical protein
VDIALEHIWGPTYQLPGQELTLKAIRKGLRRRVLGEVDAPLLDVLLRRRKEGRQPNE